MATSHFYCHLMFTERPPPAVILCLQKTLPPGCHPEASEGPCIQLINQRLFTRLWTPECPAGNTRSLGGLGMTAGEWFSGKK